MSIKQSLNISDKYKFGHFYSSDLIVFTLTDFQLFYKEAHSYQISTEQFHGSWDMQSMILGI